MFPYRHLNFQNLETRLLLASDWQNAGLVCDVDASGRVTALDVLHVVNDLNSRGARQLPSRTPISGDMFLDVSGDQSVSALDVLLIVNAINLLGNLSPAIVGGLSPDSDPNNNGLVLAERITVRGQALPNSTVQIILDDQLASRLQSVADERGRYEFAFDIDVGIHSVVAKSRDDLGRAAEMAFTVQRGNAIQDWNAAVLDIVRQWTTTSNDPYPNRIVPSPPPLVARNLAMIHVAMFDAVNAVSGQYRPYLFSQASQPIASAQAASASAAFEVAKSLYSAPDEIAVWQASLDETLRTVPVGDARTQGIELGRLAAQAILANRAQDGSAAESNYLPTSDRGHWNRTFPDFLPPLLPQWSTVKPFALTSPSQFRPQPPPNLESAEYAGAVDEVMRLGSFQSLERTSDQTEIALFWADGSGTFTPPGHWNKIASDVMSERRTNLIETARTFALLNIAMADAGIAAWDSKYHFDLWRPIDAIVDAQQAGSGPLPSGTQWIPLLKTPPFPAYTSGHSAFSGAASVVLARLFGDQTAFDSQTDGHRAAEQRPLDPTQIVTRHFTSFTQAAEEAGLSRIYGGIHFNFDNTAGLELGRKIGDFVVTGPVLRTTV